MLSKIVEMGYLCCMRKIILLHEKNNITLVVSEKGVLKNNGD
jgi:hypothetical protein